MSNKFSTFPYKLWQLMNECTDGAIRWNDTGESIVIDKTKFCDSTCVGRIFKPIQWSSFVRQLNMYGFRKTASIHQHSQEPCVCECHLTTSISYTHEHFRPCNYGSLTLVTRSRQKSKSGYLNTVAENANDINGNAPQSLPLSIEHLENESKGLRNWNEATVPTDMLKRSEFNRDVPETDEQNSAYSIDLSVDIDHSELRFYRVESPMDATSCKEMPSSSEIYCQVRNISELLPKNEMDSPYLYFSQSDDTGNLTDLLQPIPKVEIPADDGFESMEVDVEIEFLDCYDSIINDTKN
ncbi:heat shock factor protein-like [Daphnia pulicaria]|uniref:heat shock factor protein-like n=1 Tax=Daphnia pulicaria TaxID=35523 RepID=UPI001EECA316|nr:heat shock factor protein-like [Daphnia pulicaria]